MERLRVVLWAIFVVLVVIALDLVFGHLISIDGLLRSASEALKASLRSQHGGPKGIWIPIVLLFICSGAAGGILSTLSLTDIEKVWNSRTALPFSFWKARDIGLSMLIGAAGGVGGAMTAVFVMSIDGKFKFPDNDGFDDAKVLTYIGTGLVSGFVGFRLIRGVAEEWWKQKLRSVENSVDEIKCNANERPSSWRRRHSSTQLSKVARTERIP